MDRFGRGAGQWSWLVILAAGFPVCAEDSRFAQTHSRSQYVHWIDLYDAADHRIDVTKPDAPPYSPLFTCGRCHDYQTISHGYHFNAMESAVAHGRAGEPWIWTDPRTGTQLPLSYRGWQGTYDPRALGVSPWDFVVQFGRHFPGGGPGESSLPAAKAPTDAKAAPNAKPAADAKSPPAPAAAAPEKQKAPSELQGRWKLSGALHVDCMFCHSSDRSYSPETWWTQVSSQNFLWAPTAALGIGGVEGKVADLSANFDPSATAPTAGPKLPRTTYGALRINGEKKVFVDVIRKPRNDACYYCHSTRLVGAGAGPSWTSDEDVHLRAGMSCADCHRNGIEHQTVRGYEGEQHPSGESVATLSCRGCHMGEVSLGGRLGAPRPLHRGLPPLHLEKVSCTSCHSGPRVGAQPVRVQTAMAHGLGLPSHDYTDDTAPVIVAPVLLQDNGVLYPHRMVWPSFWGFAQGEKVTPLSPQAANDALRRVLRVRSNSTFAKTISDNFLEKLAESLAELKKTSTAGGAEPVFVSGGRAYRLKKDSASAPDPAKKEEGKKERGGAKKPGPESVEEFSLEAAKPYAWKLAHDVRPARWSTGAKGCYDCHSAGSPFFEGKVAAVGQAPDKQPITRAMYELAGFEKGKLDAWNQSFQGRAAFKWAGFLAMGVVGLILLTFAMVGLNGLFCAIRRR